MPNQSDLDPQTTEAISAALESNWSKAIELNNHLIKKYPDDVDTLNRLARALSETGDISTAKKCYQKVLELDPYNQIAKKNISRLESLKNWKVKEVTSSKSIKGDTFLEESGKTTVVTLVDTAMNGVLADLRTGDEITLTPHRSDVTAISSSGKRIGMLSDEIAKILSSDLRSGSKFSAFIKSVTIKGESKNDKSQVVVFIREDERSPKVIQPPFPISASAFTPYLRQEAVNVLANQAPVQTESDDNIEEVEVKELIDIKEQPESLEDLAEKEQSENDQMNDE